MNIDQFGYFNRQGEPITIEDFGRLFEDLSYRFVADDHLDGGWRVATIWTGFDGALIPPHDGPPNIFETTVFPPEGGTSYQAWHAIEADAIKGHAHAIEWVKERYMS